MDRPSSFLTTPVAILLGSLVISVAILIHGGVIKLNPKLTGTQANVAAAPSPAGQAAQPQQPKVTLTQIKEVFSKSKIKFGDANKKLVIIEAADPSCPFCHVAAGKNPELNKQMGTRFTLASEDGTAASDSGTYLAPVPQIKKLVESGKAAFAWLYFPGHGNGELGSKAMYCANDQGKFWEAHDLLMTNKGYDLLNNQIKNDKAKSGDMASFLSAAVDSAALKACLDSGKYDTQLNDDTALAQTLGISGTPGFYFNTTQFNGAYSYKDMESVVKSALGI